MAIQNIKSQMPPLASHQNSAADSIQNQKIEAKTGTLKLAKSNGEQETGKTAAQVKLSPQAKEMGMARRIAEETPDIRQDQVEKYKALIANGSYRPDSGKIADGILREAMKDEIAQNAHAYFV